MSVNIYDSTTGTLTRVDSDSSNYVGTKAAWDQMTAEEKAEFDTCDFTDDANGYAVDSAPTDSSNNLVTSGGVYDAVDEVKQALAKKVNGGGTSTTKSVGLAYDTDNWITVDYTVQSDNTHRRLLFGNERGIMLCDNNWNPYWELIPKLIGNANNIAYVNTNSTTASKAYVKGEQFILDGILRKAKSAIASGATLTLNSNYENALHITAQLEKWTMNVNDMSQITPSPFQLPTGVPYINVDLTTAIPADASRVIVMMSFSGTVNVSMELLKGKSMNFHGFGSKWGCEIVWNGTKVHIGYGFNQENTERTVSSVIYYV